MRVLVVSVLLVFGFPVIMNDVVDSFNTCSQFFLDEKPPVIPDVLENSVSQNNNRYKIICQQYKSIYRFATLYDTNKKIPIFSAYRYTGHHKEKRPNFQWRIESQLDVNQAHDGDYKNNGKELDRGHLFPRSYAVDVDTDKSTYTLTNAVPQYKSFNGGSWKLMEQSVRDIMDFYCRDQNNPFQTLAFGLTGAVASQENLLNNSVNIPTHMWTVYCCYDLTTRKLKSQAHWAENIKETGNVDIPTITLERLEKFLQTMYGPGITLFTDACRRQKKRQRRTCGGIFKSVKQWFYNFLMSLKKLFDFARSQVYSR